MHGKQAAVVSFFFIKPDLEVGDESQHRFSRHDYRHERRKAKRIHLGIRCETNARFGRTARRF